ncbi:hypothetical protein, partial [Paracoccus nototheniae]
QFRLPRLQHGHLRLHRRVILSVFDPGEHVGDLRSICANSFRAASWSLLRRPAAALKARRYSST